MLQCEKHVHLQMQIHDQVNAREMASKALKTGVRSTDAYTNVLSIHVANIITDKK
tara:strand:- start:198 stop:362 length:165 start_codon:yes stop_codon:yes gene_type:complete